MTKKQYFHQCAHLWLNSPISATNAYPDQNSTYFVGQFKLPANSYLKLRGHYGHLRYFSYTVANQASNGGVQGGGHFLRDNMIEPDEGSINPFVAPNSRDTPAERRQYTIYIRPGKCPELKQPHNTLYTGTGNVPMPPHEKDGLGVDQGLPTVTLHITDAETGEETVLSGSEMCRALSASKTGQVQEFSTKEWLGLVAMSWNPTNAPALSPPVFQRFWNMGYSVEGAFIRDYATRVQRFPADDSGAWLNNPDTVYMVGLFSLALGEVVVINGKMPTFSPTKRGEKSWQDDSTQLRYWSLTTGGTAPSGLGWASIFDEEVPLKGDREYTIVMSRAIDRPKNACLENKVKWIEFGAGEGHFIGARSWVNSVYIRFQASLEREQWPQSPLNIKPPTVDNPMPQDQEVMGDFYPVAKYMTKEEFENS